MPIYEYQCKGCAHEFETIQKLSEPALITCPSCGKDLLKKKISASAFRLKGAGWYETDFKSGDKRNVHGRDDGGESKSADATTSSDGKSESKDSGPGKTTSESGSSAPGNGGAAKEPKKEAAKPKKTEKTDAAEPKGKSKPKGGATD
jgi:putative FmdB family regulatory protein